MMAAVKNRSRPVSRLDSFPLWIHWRWRFGSTSWPPTSWSVSLSLSWRVSPLTSGTTHIRATATATWSRTNSPSQTVSGSLPELFSVKDRDSILRSITKQKKKHNVLYHLSSIQFFKKYSTAWTLYTSPTHTRMFDTCHFFVYFFEIQKFHRSEKRFKSCRRRFFFVFLFTRLKRLASFPTNLKFRARARLRIPRDLNEARRDNWFNF